jgi:uncharacterized protein YjbI with pentapeptide repeats
MRRRRRELTIAQASQELAESRLRGRDVVDIVFPHMTVSTDRVNGLTFQNCDVGQLRFARSLLRRPELRDCSFIDCGGAHHLRYDRMSILNCRWERGRIRGFVGGGTTIADCEFVAAECADLQFRGCVIGSTTFDQVNGDRVIVQECELDNVTFTGRVVHFNLVECRLTNVNLQGLNVRDGALLANRIRNLKPPDFEDSFLVTKEKLVRLLGDLEGLVRPEALRTLHWVLGTDDGFELEMMDGHRFDTLPDDAAARLTREEQRLVLERLWGERALEIASM